MTNKKLQELRDLILEANPKQGGRPFKFAPIGLSEVLMALGETNKKLAINCCGEFLIRLEGECSYFYIDGPSWNLNKDLDQQDDSTKEALYELLKGEL